MNKIKLNFIIGDTTKTVFANIGESILDVARHNDIPLEAACDGCLSCATCHVIIDKKWYDEVLKNSPKSEIEEDLLEYATELEKFSRLGCQVKVNENMEGAYIYIPKSSRNFNLGEEE